MLLITPDKSFCGGKFKHDKKNVNSFDCLVFTSAVYSKIEWNYV